MAGQIKLTGMVLASMPVGDYDRRLTILTRERGKICAFAKGARRPTSPLLGCSQPFVFGEFLLQEGKSYHIVSAEISNYFGQLREDAQAIYYAMYFGEFSCSMTKENLEAGEHLKLLYMTLRALTKPALNKRLIRRIFELRFMAISGEMPQVDSCVICKKEEMFRETRGWFSVMAGGICCESCRKKRLQEMKKLPKESLPAFVKEHGVGKNTYQTKGVWIQTSTIYTMQYSLATPLEKLYTFAVSQEVLQEFSNVMEQFLEHYVGYKMKSEELLEVLG